MLRNAFEYLATETTLANILSAISGVIHNRKPAASPVSWDGSELDFSNYDEVEFAFDTMTGGPWTPQRKISGMADWQDWPAKDSSDAPVVAIANSDQGKIFRIRARGIIRLYAASGALAGHVQEA